jgi:hypothetical protein
MAELAEGLLPPDVLHVTVEAAVNGVRTLRMAPAEG